MVPDAPFILSLAALNASLAGLGGLLVGLRRASGFDPLDSLRLRQVVEFAFANLLLAISVQPLSQLLGDVGSAVRVSSAATLVYVVVALLVLDRRVARVGIVWGRAWAASAVGLTVIGVFVSAAAIVVPATGRFESLLVVMLARPIVVFLLVLGTIDDAARRGPVVANPSVGPAQGTAPTEAVFAAGVTSGERRGVAQARGTSAR